ncbi:GPP34 family phosphoprotein [Streptomyces durmitorensis]|uniref:GPP34 family phosphoprotein n=1 Tax=Streptomyces durmitorensis TaxID=319947 RepID=A0ABY4PPY4_9ACTN|nr:GPP34 family phosphoprotein [Streptomyces durmitorensis]UQT55018.1 GPP34 family phosphoprotein [Streptomyces durmitorensis]
MPYGSLSLPTRIFLLAWDTGRDRITGAPDLHFAVRACALAELAQRGLLSDVDGIATPVFGARTGDLSLDGVLELIEESRPRRWRGWITHKARATQDGVRDQLVSEGYLRTERTRVLGIFPSRRYELERAGYVEVLHAEALAVLRGPVPVSEVPAGDAALVVCAATGKLRGVISGKERRQYKERLDALTDRSGAPAPELPELMRGLRKALASAVSSAEAARASSGGGGGGG